MSALLSSGPIGPYLVELRGTVVSTTVSGRPESRTTYPCQSQATDAYNRIVNMMRFLDQTGDLYTHGGDDEAYAAGRLPYHSTLAVGWRPRRLSRRRYREAAE